jgi:nucleotide-binding universal stress UspA family protein
MFEKLLVPTDFSAESENALNYAYQLAKVHQAKIVLMHVCKTGMFSLGKSKEKEELAKNKMKALKEKFETQGTKEYLPELDIRVVHGRVADEIIRYATKNKISFVIMGFKGEGHAKNSMVGRNTLELILRSPVPVLSIPQNSSYRTIHKIVYTNHNARTENTNFNTIVKIAEHYQAEVVILRPKSKKNEDNSDTSKTIFSHKRNIFKYQNIHKYYSESDDLGSAMQLYVKDESPDLISLGIHEDVFFERMVRQTYSQDIAPNYSIPLLSTSL